MLLISYLNVNDSVKLLGFKSNPYPYIEAGDLYVCSSFTEGYPISILEAIVLEKPILATKITGPKDILENGKYGILCENTECDLENSLKKVLLDKERLKDLKKMAINRKIKLSVTIYIDKHIIQLSF